MAMNELLALVTFAMATQGAEEVTRRKKSSRLPRVIKRVVEINSSVRRKAFGCMMRPSASAQDLRFFELEKEKKDVSSPRGVLEACIRGFNDDSSSSDVNSSRDVTPRYPRSHWQKLFKKWKEGSVKSLPYSTLSRRRSSRRKSISARENPDINMCIFNPKWKIFSLSELNSATNNFSQDNLIGKGGFAEVYKGCLSNRKMVAVKRLNKGTGEDQMIGFLSEIGTITHVNHPNTAKLLGYGVEGGTFLVLELSPLGSLGSLLRGSREKLDWAARYKIILGTAKGLLYLHENCQRRIIHRDIKADNILLTENFEPQICDFGLAKWLPKQWTHHSMSKFEGTFGYFAPEYFMYGIVDEKTDVFAYGVLVLELITGRRALDDSKTSLVLWAKPLLNENSTNELVDPILGDNYNLQEMLRVIFMASWCIEETPVLRPRMNQVVMLLTGEDDYEQGDVKQHKKRDFQRTYSEELFDAEEYNSTKYLNNRTQANGKSSPRIRERRRTTLEELLLLD